MTKSTPVRNPVKKGDVVALRVTHSTTYAFGSGRGTEVREAYTLAIVNGAGRGGEATSLERVSRTILQWRRKDYDLKDVMTINETMQPAARKVFNSLNWESDEFDTQEELKAAIRKEHV